MARGKQIQDEEIPSPGPEDRLLTIDAVCRLTQRSRSSIYRDIEKGAFPRPLKTGAKTRAWPLSEIREWRRQLPRAQKTPGA